MHFELRRIGRRLLGLTLLGVCWGGSVSSLFAAPSAVTSLSTSAGPFVGSVRLTWVWVEALAAGSSYYIQHSTGSAHGWNSALAQIIKATGPVNAGQGAAADVGGLDIGRNGSDADISPKYYFRLWVATGAAGSGAFSNLSNGATLTAALPGVLATGFTDFGSANGWLATADDANSNNDSGLSVGRDTLGNGYITGYFHSGANSDIIVRKYNSAGTVQWTKYYNGAGNGTDQGNGIAVDGSGNVYVAGYESRTGTAGSEDICVRKYDTDGLLLWATSYNSPANSGDYGRGIAVDTLSGLYVIGTEDRSADVAQNNNVWVRKYEGKSGFAVWTSTYNSPANSDDRGFGIAVDINGNVYTSGEENRSDLSQGRNVWVRKYNSSGLILWTTGYNGSGNDWDAGLGVAADSLGNVYIAGSSSETTGGMNVWLGKYDTNGKAVWTATYNGLGNSDDAGNSVTVDASGNVYVAGSENRSDLNQSYNIWVRKYDSNGLIQWTTTYNSSSNSSDQANGIAADSSGNVYVTGFETVTGQGTNIWLRRFVFDAKAPEQTSTKITVPDVTSGKAEVRAGDRGFLEPQSGKEAAIVFQTPEPGTVEIKVYTLNGNLVWETSKAVSGSGQETVNWSGKDLGGNGVGSGIYLVHVKGPGIDVKKKVAVIR